MAYLDLMQSGMSNMVQAGEAGRRDADSMAGPLNGAIGDLSGGLGELTNLPGVSSADAAKLQRAMRGISAAQSKINQVVSTFNRATRVATAVSERVTALNEQVGKLKRAVEAVTAKADAEDKPEQITPPRHSARWPPRRRPPCRHSPTCLSPLRWGAASRSTSTSIPRPSTS